ncbi:aspartate ammonia-lyase [Ignatzschineria ureiclastica]|uniref:Aspartate ammonia-lyase n=1 Tax=Ignatzschineria ureiclastica TaxID=472582 RepID=A0A2U2AFB1_9GAMM|nr:aspartate ammonia-lyase [Ignatzschineria ureiclastica]PWD81336.1 aspartate ammonia-lyase [Ignatzschineria ureiclastica]GGZ98124.1 aspartate ammonia-lyase [Ignatzschineria ureiclastica]
MDYRTEVDLLGELKVPADAYYGIHTVRAINNFTISTQKNSDNPEFIYGLAAVKKAAAQANMDLGSIKPEVGNAIVKACDLIMADDRYYQYFPIDLFQGGAGTSLNMNMNEVVANIALELLGYEKGRYDIINPNDHVNESQSTNDAYPTGMRVGFYKVSEQLIEAAEYLYKGLKAKEAEFADVLKMGRTQLQDAVPMTLGMEFGAFAFQIRKGIDFLKVARQPLLSVNLGGTAIGTGINTPAGYSALATKYLAEITGFAFEPAGDLIAATSDLSDFVYFHSALKGLAVKLGKMANDLRLLSSGPRTGLKDINLPELQAGSSIMPAKVNPVLPEAVNNACFKVFGNDTTVLTAAEAGQLQLNAMEPVIAQSTFESMMLLTNACRSLQDRCIAGITANEERCLNYILNSIGIITYLNPVIGHSEGDIVGSICAKTGKSVREVILERKLMSAEDFDAFFSVENLRKTLGLQ